MRRHALRAVGERSEVEVRVVAIGVDHAAHAVAVPCVAGHMPQRIGHRLQLAVFFVEGERGAVAAGIGDAGMQTVDLGEGGHFPLGRRDRLHPAAAVVAVAGAAAPGGHVGKYPPAAVVHKRRDRRFGQGDAAQAAAVDLKRGLRGPHGR